MGNSQPSTPDSSGRRLMSSAALGGARRRRRSSKAQVRPGSKTGAGSSSSFAAALASSASSKANAGRATNLSARESKATRRQPTTRVNKEGDLASGGDALKPCAKKKRQQSAPFRAALVNSAPKTSAANNNADDDDDDDAVADERLNPSSSGADENAENSCARSAETRASPSEPAARRCSSEKGEHEEAETRVEVSLARHHLNMAVAEADSNNNNNNNININKPPSVASSAAAASASSAGASAMKSDARGSDKPATSRATREVRAEKHTDDKQSNNLIKGAGGAELGSRLGASVMNLAAQVRSQASSSGAKQRKGLLNRSSSVLAQAADFGGAVQRKQQLQQQQQQQRRRPPLAALARNSQTVRAVLMQLCAGSSSAALLTSKPNLQPSDSWSAAWPACATPHRQGNPPTSSTTPTSSSGALQRAYLVEDQARQRVRAWLEAQPFGAGLEQLHSPPQTPPSFGAFYQAERCSSTDLRPSALVEAAASEQNKPANAREASKASESAQKPSGAASQEPELCAEATCKRRGACAEPARPLCALALVEEQVNKNNERCEAASLSCREQLEDDVSGRTSNLGSAKRSSAATVFEGQIQGVWRNNCALGGQERESELEEELRDERCGGLREARSCTESMLASGETLVEEEPVEGGRRRRLADNKRARNSHDDKLEARAGKAGIDSNKVSDERQQSSGEHEESAAPRTQMSKLACAQCALCQYLAAQREEEEANATAIADNHDKDKFWLARAEIEGSVPGHAQRAANASQSSECAYELEADALVRRKPAACCSQQTPTAGVQEFEVAARAAGRQTGVARLSHASSGPALLSRLAGGALKRRSMKILRGFSLDQSEQAFSFSVKRLTGQTKKKSQSSKLIVINSEKASYTIRAKPSATTRTTSTISLEHNDSTRQRQQKEQATSSINDNKTSSASNQTQRKREQSNLTTNAAACNQHEHDKNANNDNSNLEYSSVDVEYQLSKGAKFVASRQTSSRLGSCKNYLVKKISSSRLLAFGERNRDEKQKSKRKPRETSRKSKSVTNGHEKNDVDEDVFGKQRNKNSCVDRIATSFSDSGAISRFGKEPFSSQASSTLTSSTSGFRQTSSSREKHQLVSSPRNRSKHSSRASKVKKHINPSQPHSEFKDMSECERVVVETKNKTPFKESQQRFETSSINLQKSTSGSQNLLLPAISSSNLQNLLKNQAMINSGPDQVRSMMDTIGLSRQQNQSSGKPDTTINSGEIYGPEAARSCGMAAKRLRELVAHLEHGSVPQSVLYQTLEYAASVLDSVTMDQISRVSDEEDGDLSEVQSDAVPNEVRKWLETTFTRNSISQKRKSEDKLKFRSVANAIRAGIVVDRIYRRTSACTTFVSAEVSHLLKSIDHWSFDCFSVNQVSNGQVLKSVGYELFNRYGLMYKFKIPTATLKNFLSQIELGYVKHKNPYHNNLHAADVTQTVHYMLWQAGLTSWLTDLEIFATLLAAIIHDYLHTGTTNNFHVMSQSDTALIYNDRAVLENFHICQAFTLMKNEDCNILAGLTKDEYREFRSLVIDMVLATDMSSHFQQIKAMKNILNHSDNFDADKSKILSLVIHISDISHPAKEWEIHSKWTQLLMEEFFRQGDREKELDLECSPLCDRETTLVAESQLGFIEFIVSPSLEVCGDVLDRVHYQMAEANARPVYPASAKAASMVAASVTSSKQPEAIEAPPAVEEEKKQRQQPATSSAKKMPPPLPPKSFISSPAATESNQQQQQQQQQQQSSANHSSSQSSLASSFVSSESITSNLRKMIVSSSATLGRKLNISSPVSTSSSATSASSAPTTSASAVNTPNSTSVSTSTPSSTSQQRSALSPPALIKGGGSTSTKSITSPRTAEGGSASDFETRQANYKHPVIQAEHVSGSLRPRSAQAGFTVREPHSAADNSNSNTHNEKNAQVDSSGHLVAASSASLQMMPSNQQISPQKSNRLTTQSGELGSKRGSNSALSSCSQASSQAASSFVPFKIHRPWIGCLERNKKIWHERAIVDAQAREQKEKLKQQQLESQQQAKG